MAFRFGQITIETVMDVVTDGTTVTANMTLSNAQTAQTLVRAVTTKEEQEDVTVMDGITATVTEEETAGETVLTTAQTTTHNKTRAEVGDKTVLIIINNPLNQEHYPLKRC